MCFLGLLVCCKPAQQITLSPDRLAVLNRMLHQWLPASQSIDEEDAQLHTTPPRSTAVPSVAVDQQCVFAFSYGSNMGFESLGRKEVKTLSRDPAVIVDPTVRLVFRHKGGQWPELERNPGIRPSTHVMRGVGKDHAVGHPAPSSCPHHPAAGQATLESLPADQQPRFPPLTVGGAVPRVHGVLYRIKTSDLKKLQQRESGYIMKEMEVCARVSAYACACVCVCVCVCVCDCVCPVLLNGGGGGVAGSELQN